MMSTFRTAIAAALIASPALADLTDRQAEAKAVIAPALVAQAAVQIPDADPEVAGGGLADCIVKAANRRELGRMIDGGATADGALPQATTDLVNAIMVRNETFGCVAALVQGG
ncbi:MAG: hypothetical protein ACU0CO_07870 [Shimia sp.]